MKAAAVSLAVLLFSPLALALASSPADPAAAPAAKPAAVPTTAPEKGEQTLVLDPFEVKTDKDVSYSALNSNSLALFNVELDKVPVVADIMTQQLIQDTAVRSIEDLFNNYAGGAGRAYATVESDSNATQPGDRFSSDQYGVRGVAAGLPRRDGFQNMRTQQNETSLFDVERVDVVRGSQGLMYGAAGAGGSVNMISKEAKFNSTSARFSERIDQYGSHQSLLDANEGIGRVGLRLVALHDANQTRRLFIGNKTDGLYGQLAFKLPFKTTLRLNAETTHNHRQLPNNGSVQFPTALNDPRTGLGLLYLIATNQTGATNPVTGAAYPGGAILNGKLTTENYASFLGNHSEDDSDVRRGGIAVDSVWTKWLSTSFATSYYLKYGDRDPNGSANLLAPPYVVNGTTVATTNNPLTDWAVAPTFSDSSSSNRAKMYRASALFTHELFDGKVQSKTAIGFDRVYEDTTGGVIYNYYLAGADGTVAHALPGDTTKPNLGRTVFGTLAWSVGNGPVFSAPGTIKSAGGSIFNANASVGKVGTYVREVANPRSQAWITPSNPLGLASLYAASLSPTHSTNGISGGNASGFEDETKNQGYFVANYTDWFHDKFQTFAGFRESNSFERIPNLTNTDPTTPAYSETRGGPFPSYNGGFVYKLMHLPGEGELRAYYGYSRTFNVISNAVGTTDAYGNISANPTGVTHDFGFKFTAWNNRLSGSLGAFVTNSNNEAYSVGSTYRDTVNPTGMNGAFVSGPIGKGNFGSYNKTSRGVELGLTAQPTRNWGMRLQVTFSDGKVKNDSDYPMLYNDQFFTNSAKTAVQYSNGQPFLVPAETDTAGLAALNKLVGTTVGTVPAINPSSISTNLVPLTVAMINDVNSNYYAFGKGTLPTSANYPLNGSVGTGTTGSGDVTLKKALKNFAFNGTAGIGALTGATGLPFSAMQYNFADPANYGGVYVVQRKGDATVGYPAFRFNYTTYYTFTEGWLKGLRPGGNIAFAADNRTYWYATPDRVRHLYASSLENPTVNAFLSYSHKFGRYAYSTQLNVNNLFNHYQLNFTPNNGTGFTNAASVGISYSGEPRLWVWTNSIGF